MSIFGKSLKSLYGKTDSDVLPQDILTQKFDKEEVLPSVQPKNIEEFLECDSNKKGMTEFELGYLEGKKHANQKFDTSQQQHKKFLELTLNILSSIRDLKKTLIKEFESICRQEIPKVSMNVLTQKYKGDPYAYSTAIQSLVESMEMEGLRVHCSKDVFDILDQTHSSEISSFLCLDETLEKQAVEIKFA